jgi:FkbM family methyltransferase
MGKAEDMESVFTPFLREPARHLFRLLFRPHYRTLCFLNTRYARVPRYENRTVRIQGWTLETPDVASLISAYREIFVNQIYSFPHSGERPFIVDAGANIGLSILFFKTLYPQSRILAFEADPTIFKILEQNLRRNGIQGTELVQKAVWTTNGELEFSQEGADGGRLNTGNDARIVRVPAVRFADVLARSGPIDFLKMDIEGAETAVIEDSASQLENIKLAFVEFHSFPDRSPPELSRLLSAFESRGFRTHIHTVYTSPHPFQKRTLAGGMDLQLNCFFTRA